MPMIDDVAKSLVSKSQHPGCPSDAATGFVEGVPNQFALPLVYLFFKRTESGCSLGFRDGVVR